MLRCHTTNVRSGNEFDNGRKHDKIARAKLPWSNFQQIEDKSSKTQIDFNSIVKGVDKI